MGLKVERALALLTWRMLLGRRRWIAVLVCNALPVLIAWLFVIEQDQIDPEMAVDFTGGIVATIVLTGLLPLASLVFGTTAFGQEVEDGTLGYLLAKPTARWRIVVTKVAVAAAASVVAILPGVVLTGWVVLGSPVHPLIRGFAVGIPVASLLYAGIFLALSLYTRRALILGLLYVIGWEGALSRVFIGTRALSVREYATTLAEAAADLRLDAAFSSPLEPAVAAWMGAGMLAVALVMAVTRLRAIELVEEV